MLSLLAVLAMLVHDGFPLARHVVLSNQSQMNTMSAQFNNDYNRLLPENADALAGAPREPYPLYNAKLPQGRMHACLARCRLGRVDFLARPLLIHRQTSCSKAKGCSKGSAPVVSAFRSRKCFQRCGGDVSHQEGSLGGCFAGTS